MPHRMRRAVVLLGLATVALTGCTSSPVSGRVSAAPASPATTRATPTATPSITKPPPTQNAEAATPVGISCSKLVPLEVATALAKGYSRTKPYTPAAGTASARIAGLGGTTCEWTDGSTGHTLEVAVGRPSAKDLLALKNDLVERSTSVPTYGEEAYFSTGGGVGEVDAFRGKYWIVARSNDFLEPGDATGVIGSVDTVLKKRS